MSRAHALPLLAVLAVGATGCTPTLHTGWLTDSELAASRESTTEFPDAPAVSLISSRQFLFFFGQREDYTQFRHHEAFEIRNEAGKGLADVRINIPATAQLVELRARTLSRDGKVVELTQDQMVEEKAKAKEENDRFSVRIFRFPDVQVGSVLEYSYVVQYPWILRELDEQVAYDLPVHRYELEMQIPDQVHFDFRGYNIPAQLKREKDGGFTRLSLTVDHIDRTHTEWSSPDWTINRPWWSFRVRQFTSGAWASEPTATWAQNLAARAKTVDSGEKLWAGFDAKLPPDGCSEADKHCRIQSALRWLHEKTRPSEYGSWEGVRPMKEVLDGVTASGWEQAILLRRVLVDAGVQADLAPATRVLSRLVDQAYPNMDLMNHALVYVPQQKGLEQQLWIDPICVHCALGQLPEWVYGVDALPLTRDRDAQVSFVRVTGLPTHRCEARHVFTVKVDAGGDAEITYDDHHVGDNTLFEATHLRKKTEEQRKADLESDMKKHASTATLESFEKRRCDETKATCEQSSRFAVANFATLDGQRLLIPLTLLSAYEQEQLAETRRADVHLQNDQFEDETIRVKLPDGYRVESLPAAMKNAIPGLSVSIAFERTSDGFLVHRGLEWERAVHPVTERPDIREVLLTYQNARTILVSATRGNAPKTPPSP